MRFIWNRLARGARDERGFTLIELLVVLAILAIIAAIAIPNVVQTIAGAKTKTDSANIAVLQTAVDRYYLDNEAYPTLSPTDKHVNFTILIPDYLTQQPMKDGVADTEWYVNPTTGKVSKTAP